MNEKLPLPALTRDDADGPTRLTNALGGPTDLVVDLPPPGATLVDQNRILPRGPQSSMSATDR